MKLHTPSVAVGAALAVLVGILSAQNLVNSPTVEVRVVEPIAAAPHPVDVVRIVEGQQYSVPSNQYLVITALGSHTNTTADIQVLINGQQEAQRFGFSWGGGGHIQPTMSELPRPGLVAAPGDTVDVLGGSSAVTDDARAWGYLADN